MTSKEKADELIDKFNFIGIDFEQMKEGALICVNEILSCGFGDMHKPEYAAFMVADKFEVEDQNESDYLSGYEMQEYWNEVKKELEKL
jgi:hypothetical protein